MLVEFLEDIPGTAWKKGDVDDIKDGTARAFIGGAQAKESSHGEYLRALVTKSELKAAEDRAKFQTEMMEAVRGIAKPSGARTPPNGGGGVDFDKISATGTPAFEQDKSRTFTDYLRSVAITQSVGAPPELVEYCRGRLRGYSDEFTEYRVDDRGQLETVHTRQLSGGGLETIKRTGTDSLSGGPTYGFTLKPEYIGNLFRIAREASVFEDGCRRMPVTQGNEVIWPLLDQFKAPTVYNGIPQAAVFGGITLAYIGETTARVSSDAATDENRFKIHDLTGMTDFSRDYIVDNYIAMDQEVTRLFGEAIGWIRDWVYLRGDGIGKP